MSRRKRVALRRGGTTFRRRGDVCFEDLETRCLLTGYAPNASEQAFLEQLNDARANPAAYGAKIGVDLSSVAPSPPLAFDPDLIEAARLHSQDMSENNYFDHTTPQGVTSAQRVAASGYAGSYVGEVIEGGGTIASEVLKELITDTTAPYPHRIILLSTLPAFQASQMGLGVVLGASDNDWTGDTAQPTNPITVLTGAVYADSDGTGQYEEGEGLPDMQVTVSGVGTFTTYSTGGFDIPLAPGTYSVTASGPGLAEPMTKAVTIGSTNVKVDFVLPATGQWTSLPMLPTLAPDPSIPTTDTYTSAATGPDGTIYASALSSYGGPFLATLAPGANQWSTLPISSNLNGGSLAVGSDGQVYVFGSEMSAAWSPATKTWRSLPAEPTPRNSAVVVTANDGRLFVLGGSVNSVDVYSPQTDSWSTPTSLPVARTGFGAAISGGKIYVIGGATPTLTTNGVTQFGYDLARVDVYDPASNTWSRAADLPLVRDQVSATAGPGGTIVAFGGYGVDDEIYNNSATAPYVFVYSPRDNTWTSAAALPMPGSDLAATLGVDGRVYALGGLVNYSTTPLTTAEALTFPTPPPYVPGNLTQVANVLTHSAESYSYFIKQAYQHYLGRGPDDAGLSYWVDQMQNHGVTDERLEAGFIGAAEYIANHGGTGSGWVQGMYQDLLGRTPDPQGLNYWVTQLQNGANPADVAYGFAASAEREAQRINGDYQTYLGRPADSGGLSYWLNAFLNGSTNEDLIGGFAGSAEYFNAANKGNGDPRQWIDAAFEDIFHRAASTSDEDYWLGVLQ